MCWASRVGPKLVLGRPGLYKGPLTCFVFPQCFPPKPVVQKCNFFFLNVGIKHAKTCWFGERNMSLYFIYLTKAVFMHIYEARIRRMRDECQKGVLRSGQPSTRRWRHKKADAVAQPDGTTSLGTPSHTIKTGKQTTE